MHIVLRTIASEGAAGPLINSLVGGAKSHPPPSKRKEKVMSKIEPYKSPLPKGFYENLKNLNREVNFKQGIGFYRFSTPIPDTPPVRPISSPDPIHIIMKMVDDTMPVQISITL